jgi:integrase
LTESREDAAARGIADIAALARKLAETEPGQSAFPGPAALRALAARLDAMIAPPRRGQLAAIRVAVRPVRKTPARMKPAHPGPAARRAVLDDTLDPDEIAAAARFAAAAKAANTLRAYAADWVDFGRWAAARGVSPLPCPPGLLCGYLAALADAGLRASTITRRATAIAHHHRAAGFDAPTASPAVREVLRGIRHTHGTAPARKTPATADLVAGMLAACPNTMIGLRDRALLTFGFAGAFRRSELLALAVADLTESPEGLRVLIRRSKTDQAGEGQEIAIPRGTRLRPVETLQAWLAAAGITEGPVFRPVLKGGRVRPGPLGDDALIRALKRRARPANSTRQTSPRTRCGQGS